MIVKSSARIIGYHGSMLADRSRTEAYRRAIHEVVDDGDVVLDLGCGTGLLSFFACEAGARHVYAVEGGEVINLARDLSVRNGLADRITFLNDLSYGVELSEAVDVIVTETLWNFGLGEGIAGFVLDLRTRSLREGGTVIPASFEMMAAPLESERVHDGTVGVWDADLHGLDYSAVRSFAANNVYSVRLEPEELLCDPAALAELSLTEGEETDMAGSASFVASRDGVMHGIGGWFRARLAGETTVSNHPGSQSRSWHQVFFPLDRPTRVRRGERLQVAITSGNNGEHWRWRVSGDPGGEFEPADHSTFYGLLLSPDGLSRLSADRRPTLSRRGEAELEALRMLDGSRSIAEIEAKLLSDYSDVLHPREAGSLVRELATRCA